MGHIDHGKSTLLDYIRKTKIAESEAGGITQRLSAYEVTHKDNEGKERRITFLDTPGHEAFTAMRSRGAKVADVAILVVSGEDGVKPQTLEALQTIKESNLPFIVAITKIDKPTANVERVKQNLAEHEIYVEGYGGKIPVVPISSKTGEGIPTLLEMVLLLSDLENLTADPAALGTGVVIESHHDPKRGIAATLIIKNGSLRQGLYVVSGESFAPVRIMENFLRKQITEATFSSPVCIIGWNKPPLIGAPFFSTEKKKEAEQAAEEKKNEKKGSVPGEKAQEAGVTVIPLFIKADQVGVAEAILTEVKKLEQPNVSIKVMGIGAGEITEDDVKRISGKPDGVVVGMNVKTDPRAVELALRRGVSIQSFDVIYKLTEWLLEMVRTRAPKTTVEELRGRLKILKTFSRTKDKQIIGGKVEEGAVNVRDHVKIVRRGEVIGEGDILELQQKKEKVGSVSSGTECGLLIASKMEIAPGDEIHSFILVTK